MIRNKSLIWESKCLRTICLTQISKTVEITNSASYKIRKKLDIQGELSNLSGFGRGYRDNAELL